MGPIWGRHMLAPWTLLSGTRWLSMSTTRWLSMFKVFVSRYDNGILLHFYIYTDAANVWGNGSVIAGGIRVVIMTTYGVAGDVAAAPDFQWLYLYYICKYLISRWFALLTYKSFVLFYQPWIKISHLFLSCKFNHFFAVVVYSVNVITQLLKQGHSQHKYNCHVL